LIKNNLLEDIVAGRIHEEGVLGTFVIHDLFCIQLGHSLCVCILLGNLKVLDFSFLHFLGFSIELGRFCLLLGLNFSFTFIHC
jgi:hypothetical protein